MNVDGQVRRIATVLTARDDATGSLNEAESAGDDAAGSFEDTEDRADRLNSSFVRLAGATTAATGAMALLTRQHGDTEQTFARMEVVSGATTDQMEDMRQTAMQVGIDLPVSMSQAADAMEQLSFAGFEAEQAINAAQGVADLAVASSMQMGEAAQTAASALNMFNLEADETHQITGTMAATFSNSATNIQELSNVLEYAGGTAEMAGISMNELASATGIMADAGIRGSRAGTALNTTIQNIVSGTGQAASALNDLNLAVDDFINAEGELNDLSVVLGTIGDEMDELDSNVERMGVATELAGQRGARALLPLLDNTDELNEKLGDTFRSEIQESIGQLSQLDSEEIEGVEEALDMDVDPADFSPEQLVSGLEDLREEGVGVEEMSQQLAIGLGISDDAAQTLAEDIHDADTSAEELEEGLGGATTASDIAASQMDTTAGMAEFMRSSFDAMTYSIYTGAGPGIEWFNSQLASGINVMNDNSEATQAIGSALAVLTGGLGIATLAIGAMIVQLKLANIQKGAFLSQTYAGAAAMWTWNSAAAAKNAALTLMTMSTRQLVAATSAKVAALGTSAAAMLAGATAAGVKTAALGALSAGFGAATAGALALWTALGPIGWAVILVTGLILGLVAVMQTDLLGAGDAASSALGWITGAAGTTVAAIQELLGIFYEIGRIAGTVSLLALLGPFAAVLVFLQDPRKWLEAGQNAVMSVVNGIIRMGSNVIISPLRDPIQNALDFITDPSRWLDAGRGLVGEVADGVLGAGSELTDAVGGVVGDARDMLPFSPAKTGPLDDIDESGASLMQTLASSAESEGGQLSGVLSGVLGDLPLPDANGSGGGFGTAAGAGGSGGGPIMLSVHQEINFTGSIESEEDIEEMFEGASDTLAEIVLEVLGEKLGREV